MTNENLQALVGILVVLTAISFVFVIHWSLEVSRLKRQLERVRADLRTERRENHDLRMERFLNRAKNRADQDSSEDLTTEEIEYLHKSLGLKP